MNLFGLQLHGDDIDPSSIAVAAVLIVELIGDDGPYLQLICSDMPIWRRLGMLSTVTASDHLEAANAFQTDTDTSDE